MSLTPYFAIPKLEELFVLYMVLKSTYQIELWSHISCLRSMEFHSPQSYNIFLERLLKYFIGSQNINHRLKWRKFYGISIPGILVWNWERTYDSFKSYAQMVAKVLQGIKTFPVKLIGLPNYKLGIQRFWKSGKQIYVKRKYQNFICPFLFLWLEYADRYVVDRLFISGSFF